MAPGKGQPMSHTPEPWKQNGEAICTETKIIGSVLSIHPQRYEDAARIVACVNGCAGLNPAAYREVVDSAKWLRDMFVEHLESLAESKGFSSEFIKSLKGSVKFMDEALAAAEQPGGTP